MSARAWLVALLCLLGPSLAHGQRFAVVLGNNAGRPHEQTLEFAERDASRMADVLTSVGGVRPEQLVLAQGATAQSARQALITTNERIRNQAADDSLLIVYYSGHSDAESLHLGDTSLPLAELEGLVRGSAARVRVLIVDACRSGTLTRGKGGRPAPVMQIQIAQHAVDGVVVLAAASAGEDAQESPDLGGSFFTHHLLSGLLGAADASRDGKITITEAYDYAYANTLRDSSATLAGAQRPSYRYDLHGQGDVVLTELLAREARARLVIPAGLDVLVMRGGATGTVIAEARTPADRPGVLSLAPGKLFIRVRAPRALFEQTVAVRAGETFSLSIAAMDRIELTRLARKGGTHVPFVAGVGLSLFTHSGITDRGSHCTGTAIHASLVYRSISVAPRIAGCRERFDAHGLDSATTELYGALGLNMHRDLLARASVYLGPEVGLSYFRQRITQSTGAQPPRDLLGGALAIQGGLDVDIGAGVAVGARALAQTRFVQLENPTLDPVDISAVFVWGAELGITKYFR